MHNFLEQVKRFIGHVPFTKDAVAMYFCMIDPETPVGAKAKIAAALIYFLSPFDAIPDMIPGLGFTEDAAVIATALATVDAYVIDKHWKQADNFFNS